MAKGRHLATRAFAMEDQRRFAAFCGDHNPLHMDALAARKTQAGAPVVHGIHAMLWALDVYIGLSEFAVPTMISARFERFVLIDTPVDLFLVTRRDKPSLEIRSGDARLASFALRTGVHDFAERLVAPAAIPTLLTPTPLDRTLEEAGAARGAFVIAVAPSGLGYTRLDQAFGSDVVRGIGALSTLIGMIAPGRHSILSTAEIMLTGKDLDRSALSYAATETHAAFNLVEFAAQGPGLSASVGAFRSAAPVVQPSYRRLCRMLPDAASAGVRALIVGGSRGLGEVTAKIIAGSGGEVCITYAVGKADAQRVAAELEEEGRACSVMALDVTRPIAGQLVELPFRPTHIYYFATARIFRQRTAFFSAALFGEYNAIYATALYDLCACFADGAPVTVFNPSSTAVDDRPRDLTEYAMAKAASEILCADISRDMVGIHVLVERLPRLATDQTTTLAELATEDVSGVIARVVRTMTVIDA